MKKKSGDKMLEAAKAFHEAMATARKVGKTKVIQCIRCGADVIVSVHAARAKFCPKHAAEEKKKEQKAFRERQMKSQTGICHRCGVEFSYIYKGKERAFCDECKNRKGGRPKSLPKKPKKKRKPTIDEIQRAAHAAGMSYGKYQAMLAMKKGA